MTKLGLPQLIPSVRKLAWPNPCIAAITYDPGITCRQARWLLHEPGTEQLDDDNRALRADPERFQELRTHFDLGVNYSGSVAADQTGSSCMSSHPTELTGRVFADLQWDVEKVADFAADPLLFDPLQPSQAALIGGLADRDKCNQCASVVLPPAQKQRFMILGGGPEDVDGQPRQRATTRVSVVDLKGPDRQFHTVAPLMRERMHVNAVILPDRSVLAMGGGATREATVGGVVDPQAFNEVFEAEI